jgi:hypothetical protein
LIGLFGGDTNLAAFSIAYAVLTVSFILPVSSSNFRHLNIITSLKQREKEKEKEREKE